jgi:ABC transporter transmembrane region
MTWPNKTTLLRCLREYSRIDLMARKYIFRRRTFEPASEDAVASSIHEITGEESPKPSYRGLYRFCTDADLALLLPAIAVSIASGLIIPAFTILLGKIFTSFGSFSTVQASPNDLNRQVTPFVAGICVIGAVAWVLGWARMALWLTFGEDAARRARERIMKGLLEKDITWFDEKVVDEGVSGNMNKVVKYYIH